MQRMISAVGMMALAASENQSSDATELMYISIQSSGCCTAWEYDKKPDHRIQVNKACWCILSHVTWMMCSHAWLYVVLG